LNPTNSVDLADSEEAKIVSRFRNDPSLDTLSGYRDMHGQTMFFSARPLSIGSEACLVCHSDPAVAPASMVAQYGPEAGFGWGLGETVAAQMVYVPASDVFEDANRA